MGDLPDMNPPPSPGEATQQDAVLVPPAPESHVETTPSTELADARDARDARAQPDSEPAPATAVAERDRLESDDGEERDSIVPKHFTAPAMISLERLDDDDTFLFRDASELEDVSALATDIARLGQLFPIDVRLKPPDRFQVISGFRRVAALRFLQREKVLARLHTDLSDDDSTLMALAAAIHGHAVTREALEAARESLRSAGRLGAAARDMLEKALATDSALAPETVEEEVDADELASDVAMRLGQCNQDLSLLADVFDELDDDRREELLTQLKYSADLVAFLESRK